MIHIPLFTFSPGRLTSESSQMTFLDRKQNTYSSPIDSLHTLHDTVATGTLFAHYLYLDYA